LTLKFFNGSHSDVIPFFFLKQFFDLLNLELEESYIKLPHYFKRQDRHEFEYIPQKNPNKRGKVQQARVHIFSECIWCYFIQCVVTLGTFTSPSFFPLANKRKSELLMIFFFPPDTTAQRGQGCLILEVRRSHTMIHHIQ
jgi:hypothetical protein